MRACFSTFFFSYLSCFCDFSPAGRFSSFSPFLKLSRDSRAFGASQGRPGVAQRAIEDFPVSSYIIPNPRLLNPSILLLTMRFHFICLFLLVLTALPALRCQVWQANVEDFYGADEGFDIMAVEDSLAANMPADEEFGNYELDMANTFEISGLEDQMGMSGFGSGHYGMGGMDYGQMSASMGGGSGKKQRLPMLRLQASPITAPAIEAAPVTNYLVREQSIKQPRLVIQPVLRQRLVEQPVLKTRLVTQPVIRRIVTQPVIQPRIIRTTQVKNRIIDQPITVPRIHRQDIVRQVLVEKPVRNAPIMRPALVQASPPQFTTVFTGKQPAPRLNLQSLGLGGQNSMADDQMQSMMM